MSGRYNTTIRQGTSVKRIATYKPGGTAMNLTGCTLTSKMYHPSDPSTLIDLNPELLDAANGKFKFLQFTREEISEIAPETYQYYVDVTDALGDEQEVLHGVIVIQSRGGA